MSYATHEGLPPLEPRRAWPGAHPAESAAPPAGAWGPPPPEPAGAWGGAPAEPAGAWGGAPAEPAGGRGAPPAEVYDGQAVDVRNQIVGRMRKMNSRHAMNAWDRRRRNDAIGPHALAFCYQDLQGTPPRCVVAVGTRLFLDDPDVRDLNRLLYTMIGIGQGYVDKAGAFDPRRTMCNREDPMGPQARYIGVAVSSLDTPAGGWARVRQYVEGPLDVPGRCFVLLADGTRMLIDRGGDRALGAMTVQTTNRLDLSLGDPTRHCRLVPDLATDPATAETWQWLDRLHLTVVDGQRRIPGPRTHR